MIVRYVILCTTLASFFGVSIASGQTLDESSGISVSSAPTSKPNGKCWALLIGINYQGDRFVELRRNQPAVREMIPELKNAANDAKAIADLLKKYYVGYDEQNAVTILTDDIETQRPTAARIVKEMNNLCQVSEEDSVLIFFAGHGYVQESQAAKPNTAVIFPEDVTIGANGKLVADNNVIDMSRTLLEMVQKIPAKHKLLVLDCCYSGQVFDSEGTLKFQAKGRDAASSEGLHDLPAFQAIASSRRTQLASDGDTGNSRFTTAFLRALKTLPARPVSGEADRRLSPGKILREITADFDQHQRPECRDLIGSAGEFCFYPKEQEKFASFVLEDKSRLMALVASRQGNWWFEETPWFIPSVRRKIFERHVQSQPPVRSGGLSDFIEVEQLKAAAEDLLKYRPTPKDIEATKDLLRAPSNLSGDELAAAEAKLRTDMRLRHMQSMIDADDAAKLRDALQQIEAELSGILASRDHPVPPNVPELKGDTALLPRTPPAVQKSEFRMPALEPEDIHLLAVVQHSLNKKEEAAINYDLALSSYRDYQKKDDEQQNLPLHMLAALCRADHGEFLSIVMSAPKAAAHEFAGARLDIQKLFNNHFINKDTSAFFRIYTFIREADEYLLLNQWSNAEELFKLAEEESEAFAKGHDLHAHVYRRWAWAHMMRWKIHAAEGSFEKSNKIILDIFKSKAIREELVNPANGAATVVQTTEAKDRDDKSTAPQSQANEKTEAIDDLPSLPKHFYASKDHVLKIAFLHNHHGIATAIRFSGNSARAARYYRWIFIELEDAFNLFTLSSNHADLNEQFVKRLINTQERLGDCNLFGDPDARDVREAVDDYGRALSYWHLLKSESRDSLKQPLSRLKPSADGKNALAGSFRERTRAIILYKQALALSLPSPIQDTEHAIELCQRADQVYAAQRTKATEQWQALGELTTKTVRCLDASVTSVTPGDESENGKLAASELRDAIEAYRDVIGAAPHRDQLEMCLFSSKVLLEHGGPRSNFQIHADIDLLLSFCRIGLVPVLIDRKENSTLKSSNETIEATENKLVGQDGSQPSGQVTDLIVKSESRAYLRPYYDAVMNAKLKSPMKHVKDLIGIRHEATLGERYRKSKNEVPVLAIYTLGTKSYLFVDLPSACSKCVSLSELYDVERLRECCYTGEQLPLPREIQKELLDWQSTKGAGEREPIQLQWEDPLRMFHPTINATLTQVTVRGPQVVMMKKGRFPFALPGESFGISKLDP